MKTFPTFCPWMKNDDPHYGPGPSGLLLFFSLYKGFLPSLCLSCIPKGSNHGSYQNTADVSINHPWFPELLWRDPDPSGFCHSSPLPNPQTPFEKKEPSKKPPFPLMIYVPFPANDLQSWSPRTSLSLRNCKLSPRDCFLFPPAHLGWLSIVTGHPVHIRKKGTTWG